jgi:hypothetical protein
MQVACPHQVIRAVEPLLVNARLLLPSRCEYGAPRPPATRKRRDSVEAMAAPSHLPDTSLSWPGAELLHRSVRAIEEQRALDIAARALDPVAHWLTATPLRRDVLLGRWIGHAAHPFLTDIPIGSWTSASILDLLGGRAARPSAQLLTAVGTLSAAPTVLTGIAEWAATEGPARRVGVVHATSNAVAVGLYASSWSARRRGRHARGALLALAGMTVATVGGYLGGHMISVLKVSSTHEPPSDAPGAGA